MFKIIGADGKEYGPISADGLKKWIAEGRLNAHTQVLADGATEWQTLGEAPELAAALPIAAPPAVTGASGGEGGTPLPPDVRERDYDIDLGGCFGRAWALLTGPTMWLVIGGTAIFLLIQAGLSGFAQIPLIGLLFSLASLIIGGPLVGGVYYFVLRCLRGEAAEVGDIFAGFKYRFLQLFLGQIVVVLIAFASVLPGIVVLAGGVFLVAHHRGGSEVAGIGVIAFGALLMLIPLIYLSVSWFFTLPLIMDKRLDFWPAMSLSRAVVGKHWWVVFVLSILAGIVSFLGLLLCCVGAFFTVPLGLAVTMCAYEKMFSLSTNATPSTP
jgi:hypothetical protein